MVLCEGSFVMSTVASLMMNGVCCLWQMEEENDRQMQQREAIRQDIRVEYERQRQIEQEIWKQRQEEYRDPSSGSNLLTENWYAGSPLAHTELRRRKLMEDKRRLSLASQESLCDDTEPPLVQQPTSPLSRQPIKKRKIRVASPPRTHIKVVGNNVNDDDDDNIACVWTGAPKSNCECSDMSSLMDMALEDEEEDNNEGNQKYKNDNNETYPQASENDCTMEQEEITSLVEVNLH